MFHSGTGSMCVHVCFFMSVQNSFHFISDFIWIEYAKVYSFDLLDTSYHKKNRNSTWIDKARMRMFIAWIKGSRFLSVCLFIRFTHKPSTRYLKCVCREFYILFFSLFLHSCCCLKDWIINVSCTLHVECIFDAQIYGATDCQRVSIFAVILPFFAGLWVCRDKAEKSNFTAFIDTV